jgi:protein-S-isoprenylcysteine O-methyltransferase Ste14
MRPSIAAAGAFIFLFLFLARIEQAAQGNLVAWFLAVQSGLVAARIVFRKPARATSPYSIQLLAWLSAIAPLAMTAAGTAYLSIPGLALSIWSLWSLGDSFSISPSDRGIVQRGPYRLVRHPMYAGELLSLLGVCVMSASIWNWTILAVFGVSIYMRIVLEESILQGYSRYTRETKWRLLPCVW